MIRQISLLLSGGMTGPPHPVLKEMLSLGGDQKAVLMAFQTYLELCEEFAFNHVQHFYNSELDQIYLAGGKDDMDNELYVPVHVQTTLKPEWLTRVKRVLCTSHNTKSFNLVIRESDSSKVVFKITNDLVPPLSPETSRKKLLKMEKSKMLDKEIQTVLQKEYALLKEK